MTPEPDAMSKRGALTADEQAVWFALLLLLSVPMVMRSAAFQALRDIRELDL